MSLPLIKLQIKLFYANVKKIFDTWLEIGVFETMICFFLMHNLHSHYMMKKMSKVTYFFFKINESYLKFNEKTKKYKSFFYIYRVINMSLYMIISMIKPFGRRDYVTKCIFIPIKAKRIVPGLRF